MTEPTVPADLASLTDVAGTPLTAEQIQGILAQIDLDIHNLSRDGKLSASKYSVSGAAGVTTDRASNLQSLLAARAHYEALLNSLPAWETSQGV